MQDSLWCTTEVTQDCGFDILTGRIFDPPANSDSPRRRLNWEVYKLKLKLLSDSDRSNKRLCGQPQEAMAGLPIGATFN